MLDPKECQSTLDDTHESYALQKNTRSIRAEPMNSEHSDLLSGVSQNLEQILCIVAFAKSRCQRSQFVFVDPAVAVRNFFEACDHGSLPFLNGLDKAGRL